MGFILVILFSKLRLFCHKSPPAFHQGYHSQWVVKSVAGRAGIKPASPGATRRIVSNATGLHLALAVRI
jgi:hypothetical protein